MPTQYNGRTILADLAAVYGWKLHETPGELTDLVIYTSPGLDVAYLVTWTRRPTPSAITVVRVNGRGRATDLSGPLALVTVRESIEGSPPSVSGRRSEGWSGR